MIKKGYKKKLMKDIKVSLKEKKEKINNMVTKETKICHKNLHEKLTLTEYRKKYCKIRKNALL